MIGQSFTRKLDLRLIREVVGQGFDGLVHPLKSGLGVGAGSFHSPECGGQVAYALSYPQQCQDLFSTVVHLYCPLYLSGAVTAVGSAETLTSGDVVIHLTTCEAGVVKVGNDAVDLGLGVCVL